MNHLARTETPTTALKAFPRAPGLRGFDWRPPEKYEPRRVVGTGSMGTVLLARDRNLDRLVAIKVLHTDCPKFLGRLQREARLLARLEHPSIVRAHDLDLHAGRLYLAMEYAQGGNLALARMEPVRLVRALRGVVDALQHAHAHGIVHRDVKPENILLRNRNGSGPALLSDFGLACNSGEGSSALRQPIFGTPLTMSPEQASGEHVGPASDVFSLGVTLYRQLTDRWPFPGRDLGDVFAAIRHRPPAPMNAEGRARTRVPARLEAIVLRALAKDPTERTPSMEQLGRELDRFLLARSLFTFPRGWSRRRAQPQSHEEPS